MPNSTTPPAQINLKKVTGVGATPKADFQRFTRKKIRLNVRRLIELHDVEEVMESVTFRECQSLKRKKSRKIAVRHKFYLVDTGGNDAVKVHKGQTIEQVMEITDTCQNNRIKCCIRVTYEKPARRWFRRWKPKYFDVLTAPHGDTLHDYVERLRNTQGK